LDIDVSSKENIYFLIKQGWGFILNLDLSENYLDNEVALAIV
jgi:hypothetical protein